MLATALFYCSFINEGEVESKNQQNVFNAPPQFFPFFLATYFMKLLSVWCLNTVLNTSMQFNNFMFQIGVKI